MHTTMKIEVTNSSERNDDTESLHTEAAKLIEIGDVSVETKGTVTGVEWGFTPHA